MTSDLTLNVEDLTFAYGRTPVLRDVTLPPVRATEITAVIGPNAAGKSTLLRCIAGFRRARGTISIDGSTTRGGVLYMPQDPPAPSSITVFEAVLVAHRLSGTRGTAAEHERHVAATLAELQLDDLATRRLADLSGGQRQMVGLAQAVTRRPDVLLLDEPTSSLDLRNQLQVLRLVRRIAEGQPAAVLAIVHDLALAARIADQVVVLHDGAVYAHGRPAEVITAEMMKDVYQVLGAVHIMPDGTLTVAVTDSA